MCLFLFLFLISCTSLSKKKELKVLENNAMTQNLFLPEDNGYTLVWEDNFRGNKLDTTKWRTRLTGARRVGYNDPSMVKVQDGNLLLMYDIKGDSVLGAMVGTQETFMVRYGYFECRAALQHSIGPWGAFWLQSPKIFEGEDPSVYGAEIDIFEYFKELGSNKVASCLHWAYGPNMQSSNQMISELEGLSEGYHTFGLEWTEKKYSFFIDGLKFHEQSIGLSHIEQYMILSMEIPEKLENIKMACAPDTFKVDYVKVYKKDFMPSRK